MELKAVSISRQAGVDQLKLDSAFNMRKCK
jgi:hypothetical protein